MRLLRFRRGSCGVSGAMIALGCPVIVHRRPFSERIRRFRDMIDLRVLGTLQIRQPDGSVPTAALTQPKRIALLVYLVLGEPPGPKSRDRMMALLWPEADDESARHSLRNALYGLRQTLGEAALISRGDLYVGLDSTVVRCDALEVRRLLTARRWEEALAAWGGDLLPGFHVAAAP